MYAFDTKSRLTCVRPYIHSCVYVPHKGVVVVFFTIDSVFQYELNFQIKVNIIMLTGLQSKSMIETFCIFEASASIPIEADDSKIQ